MREKIVNYLINNRWKSLFFASIVIFIITLFTILINIDSNTSKTIYYVGLLILAVATVGAFWDFYSGEKRQLHQINSVQGYSFLSSFYRVYFPVIILSILLQLLIAFALLPESDGGWGAIDPSVSPSQSIVLIIPTIITGIAIIALSDSEMRKRNLLYRPQGKHMNLINSLVYLLPLMGLYFGIKFFTRFIITQIYGLGAIIPVSQNFYTIDAQLITAARFWIFLTNEEKLLTLIAFIAIYVSMEFLLRGLLANEARSYNLGPGAMIFIPAIIQAIAFSSGTFIFTDTIYYLYTIFEALILGILIGIVFWRTKRFSITILFAILARAMDNTLDFYTTILLLLPKSMGKYDPADSVITTADNVAVFIVYIQFALVLIAPLIVIIAYEEVWNIISPLYTDFKSQWFGYLIIGLAFFIIDLIFSYFASINIISPLFGFFIAFIVLMFVINYLFKVLPTPSQPLDLIKISDPFEGEYPLDVISDIKWLESKSQWYEKSTEIGILGSFMFIYLLFVSGAYNLYPTLHGDEIIKYTIFLVLLPCILMGISSYLLSVSIKRGYFFADGYRKLLYVALLSILAISLYIWTISGALVQFSWRNVPFFVAFFILLFPKPVRTPTRDYAMGMAKGGRYATFKAVKYKPDKFVRNFNNLLNLPSDIIQVGTCIIGAQLGLIKEWSQIEQLRSNGGTKGNKIGGAFALGIIGSPLSEGLLLQLIENEDLDTKIVAFWALGKIGTTIALPRMARILEENPAKNLIPIAENAILCIDPQYPLAGLRDAITIE